MLYIFAMQSININNTMLEALCEGLNNNSNLQALITEPKQVLAAVQAAHAGEWFPSESELVYAAEACATCNVEFGRMPELNSMLQSVKDWALNIANTIAGVGKKIWCAIRARFTNSAERGALLALKWASHPYTAPAVVLCWYSRTKTQAQIDEILG